MNVIVSRVLREFSIKMYETSNHTLKHLKWSVSQSARSIHRILCRNVSGEFDYRVTHESKTDSLLL